MESADLREVALRLAERGKSFFGNKLEEHEIPKKDYPPSYRFDGGWPGYPRSSDRQ